MRGLQQTNFKGGMAHSGAIVVYRRTSVLTTTKEACELLQIILGCHRGGGGFPEKETV